MASEVYEALRRGDVMSRVMEWGIKEAIIDAPKYLKLPPHHLLLSSPLRSTSILQLFQSAPPPSLPTSNKNTLLDGICTYSNDR